MNEYIGLCTLVEALDTRVLGHKNTIETEDMMIKPTSRIVEVGSSFAGARKMLQYGKPVS